MEALQHRHFPKPEPEEDKKLIKEYSLIPRAERQYGAATQLRPGLADEYVGPISGREGWWRKTIKETPIPGSYEVPEQDTFLLDLDKRIYTYRFKNDGRRTDPQPYIGKGQQLLPGAYQYEDFATFTEKHNKNSYAFRDTGREARDVMNFGRKDKDINVAPNVYEVQNYLTLSCDKAPSKHSVFKSQTQRFPTLQFKPKAGPSPGNYEYNPPKPSFTVSSSFKSKTPRFSSSHTKYPGPGSYDKTYKPMSPQIAHMGKHFGLFFSPQYNSLLNV